MTHTTETDASWFLAICQDCQPVLPQPFRVKAERDEWVLAHASTTGHRISQPASSVPTSEDA